MIDTLFQSNLFHQLYDTEWLPEPLKIPVIQSLIGLALAGIIALTLHYLLRNVLLRLIQKAVRRTNIRFDDYLFDNNVFRRILVLIPLIVLRLGIELIPSLSEPMETFLQKLVGAIMILVVIRFIDSFITAAHQYYNTLPIAERRPITSYIQLLKIILYIIGLIFIVAHLADQSPWYFVSGLGAMTAILMVVFKDTLLSLVASVQLTSNDLIRVGDWIEMPQFNADGDVVDIALNTVKVVNWDKTMTIIPTHNFLNHSFKNWRNMFEGGGRRIKRSIFINSATIRFLTDEEIEYFSRFRLLRDYMEGKKRELEEANATNGEDRQLKANQRLLTNIGTLRAYIAAYLRNHPGINQNMTQLVRQLSPTPEGIPIEIYAFTSDTAWVRYEGIQADIFDHILAIIPEFGLEVYQRPSGHDLNSILAEGTEVPEQ